MQKIIIDNTKIVHEFEIKNVFLKKKPVQCIFKMLTLANSSLCIMH